MWDDRPDQSSMKVRATQLPERIDDDSVMTPLVRNEGVTVRILWAAFGARDLTDP
jgi:hypothetical protein